MIRLRGLLLAFAVLALFAGPVTVPAQAASSGEAATVSAKSKKKCGKLKGKKKKRCLKKPGKGGKPWRGSPYKPKMTCAMSPEMQKKYARYGLTCIDLGFGVTTLVEL